VKAGAQIPPRSLAVGAPAKVLRELSDDEIAWKSRGTAIYQRLALEAPEKLRPATPLSAPEPNRRRAEAPAYDPKVLAGLGSALRTAKGRT
jgi:phenylacetic acid degradation protein